jgi:putative acetyltransferase
VLFRAPPLIWPLNTPNHVLPATDVQAQDPYDATRRLRRSGDGVISLVAERDSGLIGHVLFSKLKAPMRALGLAPVAVHPSFQKQGAGLALIREGLARAKEDGWMCVFALGDPAYCGRFGVRVESARGYSSPYSGDHFMALPFSDLPKTGEIVYPEPFKLLD